MVSSRRRFRRRFRRSRKGMRRSSRRSLKKLIRNIAKGAIETRFKDFSLGTIASPITTTWSDVNIMPDGIANPPSRSYEIVGIAMKGILASGNSPFFTTDWYNRVRVVIGLWKPRTDHTFTVLSGQVSPPALWEPISTDMTKVEGLIKKYLDKTVLLQNQPLIDSSNNVGYNPVIKNFKYAKKFKRPIRINSEGGANAQTYLDKWLMASFISDSSVTPHPAFINGYLRVYYRDI